MGRGVHFQHVHVPAFHDRLAMHAKCRHLDGRTLYRAVGHFVIQRAGENSGGGGFADPAHPGQDPGLRNSPRLERIRNGADHGLLADQIVETGGAVFARQHPVGLAGLRARRQARNRPDWRRQVCRGERQHHSSVDPQLIVSQGRLAERSRIQRERRPWPHLARFARKTGRRLTSDPIRTSLGLLPSGPDPVGEWLVHRQSPGPYLGPKGPESKRALGCHTPRKRGIQYSAARLLDREAAGYWIIRFRG